MLSRVLAAIGLAVISPVLALVSGCIRLSMGAPVLFRQQRSGQRGVPFEILKFRTMRTATMPEEADEDRLSALGTFLRRSSVDELPSLWNVVRGDMAFVGPRPFMAEYASLYDAQQARRLEVKPGLTGLAQIKGRNALTWEEKFALDVWYVEHKSWRLDARILLTTPFVLLRIGSVSHPGHTTMPVFQAPTVQRSNTDLGRQIDMGDTAWQ